MAINESFCRPVSYPGQRRDVAEEHAQDQPESAVRVQSVPVALGVATAVWTLHLGIVSGDMEFYLSEQKSLLIFYDNVK